MSEPKLVTEKVELLFKDEERMEYSLFSAKLQEAYDRNKHGPYEQYNVGLQKTKDQGVLLVFSGSRKETPAEQQKREAEEAIKQRAMENEELKLYLKLKKKYGAKE